MGDVKMKNKLIRRLVTCEIKQNARIKGRGKDGSLERSVRGNWNLARCSVYKLVLEGLSSSRERFDPREIPFAVC